MSEAPAAPDWRRTAWAVVIGQGVVHFGFSLAVPFLPLYVQELGVTDRAELALWSGVLAGASAFTTALSSPVWGLLADRFGRKRMLLRSLVFGGLGFVGMAFTPNVAALLVVRLLHGAFTGSLAAAMMVLAGVLPRSVTGVVLGWMQTAVQVGSLIGPLAGAVLLSAYGFRATFLIGAVFFALAAVMSLPAREAPRAAPHELPSLGLASMLTPFRWPQLRGPLIATVVMLTVVTSANALVAIYVQDLARPAGMSIEVAVGLVVGLAAFSTAVAMPFVGALADRRDARAILAASALVLAGSLVPQAFARDIVVLTAARIVMGFGLAGATAATVVLTRAAAPPGGEGRVFAALGSANNLGFGLGPLIGAGIAASLGIPEMLLIGGLGLVGLTGWVWLAPQWFPTAAVAPTPGTPAGR